MKRKLYEGVVKTVPGFEIHLDVQYLKTGRYQLKIVNKNKVIKDTYFVKK